MDARVIHVKRKRRSLAAAIACKAGVLLVAVTLWSAAAAAQEFPALTGRVVDAADLLDVATEARLAETLAAFQARSSDQIVVATVPDLQGYSIEEFGVGLGRAWKIGEAGENNGVVLLVSRDDRKVRIEVGYGLEGTLTDALSSSIIQLDILPAFREGDYPKGIEAGVDSIVKVLSGDAAELEARAERNRDWEPSPAQTTLFTVLFFVVFFGIWAVVIFGFIRGWRNLRKAQRYGRKVGPNSWLWNGVTYTVSGSSVSRGSGTGSGSSWSSGSASSSSGGFSGGGGSFGGGGASGSW